MPEFEAIKFQIAEGIASHPVRRLVRHD
jgi:hypothetical protein